MRYEQTPVPEIREISKRATPPIFRQYDQWGRRVDDLQTSEGWRGLKAVMQKEGVPAIFYERRHGEFSRVHGFMKMLLATGDSSVVSQSLFADMLYAHTVMSADILSFEYVRWRGSR